MPDKLDLKNQAMITIGLPLRLRQAVRSCFPDYKTRSELSWSRLSKVGRVTSKLLQRGYTPVVAVWHEHHSEHIRKIVNTYGLPLHILLPGFFDPLGKAGKAAASFILIEDNGGQKVEEILRRHLESFQASQSIISQRLSRLWAETGAGAQISLSNNRLDEAGILILGADNLRSPERLAEEVALIRLAADENKGKALTYLAGRQPAPPALVSFLKRCPYPVELLTNGFRSFSRFFRIYTVDSSLAANFIAAGIPVVVTGAPFYAGWGLSEDRGAGLKKKLTIAEFFEWLYLRLPCYQAAPAEAVTGFLAAWWAFKARRPRQKLPLFRQALELFAQKVSTYTGRLFSRSEAKTPAYYNQLIQNALAGYKFEMAWNASREAAGRFPYYKGGAYFLTAARCALALGRGPESLAAMAHYCLNFDREAALPYPGYVVRLSRLYGYLPWQRALAAAKLSGFRCRPANILWTQLHGGFPVTKRHNWGPYFGRRSCLVPLARYQRISGNYQDARTTVEELLAKKPDATAFDEALLLSLELRDKIWTKALWEEIERKKIDVSPYIAWRALCGLGQLKDAYARHGLAANFKVLDPYLGDKKLRLDHGARLKQVIVLAECFPGDEIRFARLYRKLRETIKAEKVLFACDPRLYSLFKRSFPELDFMAIDKAQSYELIENINKFTLLPGPDCFRYLDNNGWEAVCKADGVICLMHALPKILSSYMDLGRLPNLQPDATRVGWIQKQLRGSTSSLVGLSWRSSLEHYNRSADHIGLPGLTPLLEMPGIQWVNCQYDGLRDEEREFLLRHFPGRLLEVSELDQYNDIDGAAALYAGLDLMVSAPVFSADLAACLGRRTLIYANSPSLEVWRAPGTNRHALMSQAELMTGGDHRDRKFLVQRLCCRIREILEESRL